MKVVILAGGRGTRLGARAVPKPMTDVAGSPVLERQIEVAKRSGFKEFLFLTGYKGDVIERYFGDGGRYGVRIDYLREGAPRGTAGAVRDAAHQLPEVFVLLYGDIVFDVDLRRMVNYHRRRGGLATLFVHPNDHPHDSDIVITDPSMRIARIAAKPHDHSAYLPNLVNAAIHVLDRRVVDWVPETGKSDWGRDVFPQLAREGIPMYAYRSVEYAKDMGTAERLERVRMDLASGRPHRLGRRHKKSAVFLDRDGVLNDEIGGVTRAEELQIAAGAGQAVRLLNEAGILAICVTNQPLLAKGHITERELGNVFAALDTALAEEGAYLDDVLYCPHHPETGWPGEVPALKVASQCRKPRGGMLREAASRHNIDLESSWMIGDRYVDVRAAHDAGSRAILVGTGNAGLDTRGRDREPELRRTDVLEAVRAILGLAE